MSFGKQPFNGATALKTQFDDFENSILSDPPQGGKRHTALSETLPKIKGDFLKQGHQFAMDKLNERSRTVLDTGLQRLAQGARGAKDATGVQAHDDQAYDLINKYVLSEAKFDAKDADAMYDKYLGYTGVQKAKPEVKSVEESNGQTAPDKQGLPIKYAAPVGAEKPASSAQQAREMERQAENGSSSGSTSAAQLICQWEKQTGNSAQDVEEHYRQKAGIKPTWIKEELGKTDYYEKRAKDFEERNPGKKAPDYYREYGDKYVRRFDELKPELSAKGQKWQEKAKDLLQFMMEQGLRSGEWDESKPEELKKKAYDSHSEAYLEAGLADLPQEDINKVIRVVDRMDMVDPKALWESYEVEKKMIKKKQYEKASNTAFTGLKHLAPTQKEIGEGARRVFESIPALPPAR